MPTRTAVVSTGHASRYLRQLCKHWSHKFVTEFTADCGMVHLTSAELALQASDRELRLDLTSADVAALPRLCEVVADHVRRFAFREDLVFTWQSTSVQSTA